MAVMYSPISGPLENQVLVTALKKLVHFHKLSVPAMKMSSPDGHFSKRATKGTASFGSMPERAGLTWLPPSVVQKIASDCADIAQSVSGLLDEMAFAAPSPPS